MKPYNSVIELGQLMLKNKPKVYPVIDDDGNLLGTICRNDVLHAIDQHLRASLKAGKKHAAH
jgi:predicted transcriptional regulator